MNENKFSLSMLIVACLTSFTVGWFFASSYVEPDEAAATQTPHVDRPHIVVADIERSLRLYRDILGFEIDVANPTSSPNSYSYTIFNIDPDISFGRAFMDSGDQKWGLAITEVKGLEPIQERNPYRNALIVNATGPVDTLLNALREEGLEVGPPAEFETLGQKRTEIAFTDHDGHRIDAYVYHD